MGTASITGKVTFEGTVPPAPKIKMDADPVCLSQHGAPVNAPILVVNNKGVQYAFIFVASGTEKIGDVEAKIVEVNADGAEARWYVDPQSGRVLRTAFQTVGMAGPTLRVTDNLEWMTVDGITLPSKQAISENGQESGSSTVKEIVINPTVDPKLFERPAEPKP